MKFIEFLQHSLETKAKHKRYWVVPGDDLVVDFLIQHIGLGHDLYPDHLEVQEVSGPVVDGIVQESSLFGRRYLVLKTNNSLDPYPEVDDVILVISRTPQPAAYFKIEATPVKTRNDRKAILEVRLKQLGLEVTLEVLEVLIDQTQDLTTIEQVLKSLELLGTVTLEDLNHLFQDLPRSQDITRALIMGNMVRINALLSEQDPVRVLGRIHAVLLKLYCWLELADQEDAEVARALDIPPRFLRDWKQCRLKYTSQRVRKTSSEICDILADVKSGFVLSWTERACTALKKLNTV